MESLDDKCEAFKLVVSRSPFDGDLASSGAAVDPLFWVAHGKPPYLLKHCRSPVVSVFMCEQVPSKDLCKSLFSKVP